MMNDKLPDVLPVDLDPIIITAPTIRSGTTLVQRLLCSSPRVLIYGETVAQDLEFFLNLYTFKVQQYGFRRGTFSDDLHRVLSGDVNAWIPDLTPDLDGYLQAMNQAAFAGIRFCRDYAVQVERPVWGFKYPGWKPAMIRLARATMPRARVIAILRDLQACTKSAKAHGHLNCSGDVRDFCAAWAEGMGYWQSCRMDPGALVIDYADLALCPDRVVDRIATFCGTFDLDPAVLAHKINTRPGDVAVALEREGYVAPAVLTDAEQSIVSETLARNGG